MFSGIDTRAAKGRLSPRPDPRAAPPRRPAGGNPSDLGNSPGRIYWGQYDSGNMPMSADRVLIDPHMSERCSMRRAAPQLGRSGTAAGHGSLFDRSTLPPGTRAAKPLRTRESGL